MSTLVSAFFPSPSDHTEPRSAFHEVHPYGPGEHGSFHTDLAVAVLPAFANSLTVALAVCEGTARVASDNDEPILLLQPSPEVTAELRAELPALGPSVVFVYRNLGQIAIDDEEAVPVPRRAALGRPGTTGGLPTLGFEIVLLPRGLWLEEDRGFARITALVASAAPTRRYDPAVFFAALAHRLDHPDHALLRVLRARVLLELRDEYDLPSAAPVSVQVPGQPAVTLTASAGSRGTLVLDAAGPVSISVDKQLVAELPSGASSEPAWTGALVAPAHLALQSIYMQFNPHPDDEPRSWFAPNGAGLLRFTAGNRVVPLRDGVSVFRQYVSVLRTGNGEIHHIHVAGWYLDDSFELVHGEPDSTFLALCTAAAEQGARVRGLLWDAAGWRNSEQVDRMNALPYGRGEGILDADTLPIGSHHQKFLVVAGSTGAVAFCGGVDINADRLDSEDHGAEGPFHDVHARIEGPAVAQIDQVFTDRWNSHRRDQEPLLPLPTPEPRGAAFVQVACTYAPKCNYPYAPDGCLAALEAFLCAIRKARHFIYIEDQYLTPYPGMGSFEEVLDTVGVTSALREALGRIDYLVMVGPNHTDQPEGRRMRANFIRALKEVAPEKVHVFYLAREGEVVPKPWERAERKKGSVSGAHNHPNEIYCHTKSWIVDDVCAKIGSANCNRRSFTHDSELDLVVVDGALQNGARAFARNYRIELWAELLGLEDNPAVLEDPQHALGYWLKPGPRARIRAYEDGLGIIERTMDRMRNFVDDMTRGFGVDPGRVAHHTARQAVARAHPEEDRSFLEVVESVGEHVMHEVEETFSEVLVQLVKKADVGWDIVDPDGRKNPL